MSAHVKGGERRSHVCGTVIVPNDTTPKQIKV
jgi:hypothetical protein